MILVHGASGGTGSYMVGFAHALGLRVVATCRAENAGYVHGLGADKVIDYVSEDIVAATRAWAPDGVDIVFDTNSGGARRDLLETLAPGGRLIVSETLTDDSELAPLHDAAERKGATVHYMMLDHTTFPADFAAAAALIDGGRMRMPEVKVYPLERAGDALAAIQAGKVRGKLAVRIADEGEA